MFKLRKDKNLDETKFHRLQPLQWRNITKVITMIHKMIQAVLKARTLPEERCWQRERGSIRDEVSDPPYEPVED